MSDNVRRNGVTRREVLGTAVRWTVPTVLTMTLGARALEAKASCPPCQKKVGATCRACTISQMLNCQCEPCLGPPYCAAVGPVAPAIPGGATGPGTQPLGSNNPYTPTPTLSPYQQMMRDRARASRNPFNQPLYDDPFGANRGTLQNPSGLYQRLRPDSSRRTP